MFTVKMKRKDLVAEINLGPDAQPCYLFSLYFLLECYELLISYAVLLDKLQSN